MVYFPANQETLLTTLRLYTWRWTQREDVGEFDLIKSKCLLNICLVLRTVLGP